MTNLAEQFGLALRRAAERYLRAQINAAVAQAAADAAYESAWDAWARGEADAAQALERRR